MEGTWMLFLSSKDCNINFSLEHQEPSLITFLDVKNCCKNDKFFTSIYRELTFTDVFTNYESLVQSQQKEYF